MPWQVPQAPCVPSTRVHTGAFAALPFLKEPWQYTFEQVVPFHVAVAPFVRASAPNVTSTTPFVWLVLVGTTWQSAHSSARRSAESARCCWWAPTARAEVAVSPFVPRGGAGAFTTRAASPWQEVQERFATSTTPFTCSPPETTMFPLASTVPGWHPAQVVTPPAMAGWPVEGGGGRPWQVPQRACVPSTRVQVGAVRLPPPSVAPWQ